MARRPRFLVTDFNGLAVGTFALGYDERYRNLNGADFEWRLDNNPQEFDVLFVTDQADNAVSSSAVLAALNAETPGVFTQVTGTPTLLMATSTKVGRSSLFQVMDGEAMTFPDGQFDMVYCHTVLHFTPDPALMVREIRRVLKPDGLAILMTVNRKSWMNWLRHVMKVEIDHLDSPVFRHMTMAEFRSILKPFPVVTLQSERFPVPTKVHKGLKAALYNRLFVAGFNALPASWTSRTGHHLLAFCRQG